MIVTMHGLSTMHCNVATEVRMARETGYEGIEFVEGKVLRYLEQGFTAEQLKELLDQHQIKATCINAIKDVEKQGSTFEEVLEISKTLCRTAEVIECPVIQLVPFEGLENLSYEEGFELTCKNIEQICDIGKSHNVKFQLEVIAWAPIHSLRQGLDVLERVDRDNLGMVIDFWHLWAGGDTTPEDVAALDPAIIYGVHFCDGKMIPSEGPWEEPGLRGYLAGEGDIDVKAWCEAVKSTGFDGTWSSELLSPKHWEWDLWEVAREARRLMVEYAS
jgi:sugar phosphate isomerase/epimerase